MINKTQSPNFESNYESLGSCFLDSFDNFTFDLNDKCYSLLFEKATSLGIDISQFCDESGAIPDSENSNKLIESIASHPSLTPEETATLLSQLFIELGYDFTSNLAKITLAEAINTADMLFVNGVPVVNFNLLEVDQTLSCEIEVYFDNLLTCITLTNDELLHADFDQKMNWFVTPAGLVISTKAYN
jgi:hypothetical protein